ncbi:MAG: siderophore-interacting protein [Thermomicrobiales bacterium]|jgi:NADPH-dependent ferric siderophore reductase|nr:siderophore-interacting protein [Thermomicrobiales bacterium]
MTTTQNDAARTQRVMHELRPRLLEVVDVSSIAPRMVRVTFTGDDLDTFVTLDADDHMKMTFPPREGAELVLPAWSEHGPVWPEGKEKPAIRDFTPRRHDPLAKRLEVDFFLHGEGPASRWAAKAQPGQILGVLGPRGSFVVSDAFEWYLMIGDETALPSIARRLESFAPGVKAVALIEVDGPKDEIAIATQADASITWVHRNGQRDALEQAVRNASFPEGEGFVWAGGEATALRGIRRYLLREANMPAEWASFSGHWKIGVADHDHHEPIED